MVIETLSEDEKKAFDKEPVMENENDLKWSYSGSRIKI
jgi:hypothetical protein